jgi:hypothetical protein
VVSAVSVTHSRKIFPFAKCSELVAVELANVKRALTANSFYLLILWKTSR